MSDREKRKILMKESPELFGLISDFKSNILYIIHIIYFIFTNLITNFLYCISAHMKSVQDKLCPFLKLVKSENLPKCQFTDYVQCYYEIIMK